MTDTMDSDAARALPQPAGWSRAAAALAVVAVLGASAALGRRNAPGDAHPRTRRWYRMLDKPDFTPPDAVFGAVWPVLETGLAVGGYRLLRRPSSPARNAAVGLWLANTAMVGGWTELFFRRHALAASTAAAGAMTAGAGALVVTANKVDRPTAVLAAPFATWLAFATVLSERIRKRNRS
ncbi:TspO and MBR related proteins [Sphingomonas guangdongensis]|uniref:TspO and MBR related proteins n=1 Tax=Sphingomonas guangdongensis TaxID=1141890 RepID=A0A285R2J0_9SPHN|nr:TspO/MBR family protein [Sphingomonas guangdongensis]SOB88315.1 TspO and MBR related proteins [Sphingomonas guangdongensis]